MIGGVNNLMLDWQRKLGRYLHKLKEKTKKSQ
jgi:hypothetical protein